MWSFSSNTFGAYLPIDLGLPTYRYDDFQRWNHMQILAEQRLALAVNQPTSFLVITAT